MFLIESLKTALSLIVHLDSELVGIIFLSIKVSGSALIIAAVLGMPLAAILGLRKVPLGGLIVSISNTFMGLPPVVVGLFVYLLLSRSGPMGFMGLLYTPTAMVIAQTVLSFPIVMSLCHAAIVAVPPAIRLASQTLGATQVQAALTVIHEARYGIIAAVIAGFGRVMAEVGAILIVGGNIAGFTRVMTTTIALETDKGNFDLALALGIILLGISFGVNMGLHYMQRKGIARR